MTSEQMKNIVLTQKHKLSLPEIAQKYGIKDA